MQTIKKDDYIFLVDKEKTQEYYQKHSLCECLECRNYYIQIKEQFPKLNSFFNDFGIDITKPDNIISIKNENCIDYISVDYTVCGTVKKMSNYEIDLYDKLFLSIIVYPNYVSPNEQKGEYFTFSVMQIKLPWLLNEPFPTKKAKNWLQKIFKA